MAGILDKIKGMFGGKKAAPAAGAAEGSSAMGTMKEKAGEVKDKVDDLLEKVGEKVPDKVKDAYEKVSDKVEDIIPGHKDHDASAEGGAESDAG